MSKKNTKDTVFSKKRSLNLNGNLLIIDSPLIMGILNITPDSFYDGGKYNKPELISKRVEQMLDEGADVIDIGACSSRPGATVCSEKEEMKRLESTLEIIKEKFPDCIISVDTFRSGVAEKMIKKYQVSIINDISAGEMDNKMFETLASLDVVYMMMHMKGTPDNMQNNPRYSDLIKEMSHFFAKKILSLRKLGLNDIIIDPGFGFGKTIEHNYEILKRLKEFNIFDLPICVGISRKSMIYKLLGVEPEDALNGTTALNTVALLNGADILRVHDVKEAKETIELLKRINTSY